MEDFFQEFDVVYGKLLVGFDFFLVGVVEFVDYFFVMVFEVFQFMQVQEQEVI